MKGIWMRVEGVMCGIKVCHHTKYYTEADSFGRLHSFKKPVAHTANPATTSCLSTLATSVDHTAVPQ